LPTLFPSRSSPPSATLQPTHHLLAPLPSGLTTPWPAAATIACVAVIPPSAAGHPTGSHKSSLLSPLSLLNWNIGLMEGENLESTELIFYYYDG